MTKSIKIWARLLNTARIIDGPLETTLKGGVRPLPGSTPHLDLKAEFHAELTDYSPSSQALATLRATPFVLMLAPTATGRNSIIRELVKTNHYYFIVSDTTRPQRHNDGQLEQNGVEYYFRTEQEVLADLKAGRYIEAEIIHDQQVSGVSVREVERAHAENKVAITDVDIRGAQHIMRLKPNVIPILLLPPSFDEWLRRINKRGAPAPQDLHRRIATAIRIVNMALGEKLFTCVVNDDFEEAVHTVDEVARFGVHHRITESHSRDVAKHLAEEAEQYLKRHAPEYLVR